jgi:hypothetical protein
MLYKYMIVKELKFIGLLFFIIFAIILLVFLIFFITFQRFKCSEYMNYWNNMPVSGKIEEVIPLLQTGDIIIIIDCNDKKENKLDCFKNSRGNFVKNSYHYSHLGMIYRKKNIVYLIESIRNNRCMKKYSLVNNNYKDGLRIVNFKKYIEEVKENTKKDNHCCQNYAIRFINRKINQKEINRRFENEFNILSDKNFNNLLNLKIIAISGWFLKDMPNNFNYSTEIFYPNEEKETFFCSEIIGVLLQRIGIMKRVNRSRMFYPADYNGSSDNKLFEKGMYSQIKIYI